MSELATQFRALTRRPLAPLLLALQLALTAAVIVNAFVVAAQEWRKLVRPTGLAEEHLLILRSRPLHGPIFTHKAAAADLAVLRALPGVVAATRLNNLPLADHGWRNGVSALPVQKGRRADNHAGIFIGDEQALRTLGLKLIEGRDFTADDLGDVGPGAGLPSRALISRALAESLFPDRSALGRSIFTFRGELTVIGVVEHLQSAWPDWPLHEQAMLLPARLHLPEALYAVRATPASYATLRTQLRAVLLARDGTRIVEEPQTYAGIRAQGYRPQRTLALSLAVLIAALLIVAGLGIYGTARYRVQRRRREIGTRRALGAGRAQILRQFLAESFLITAAGLAAGLPLAWMLNRWLIKGYDIPALSWPAPLAAALLLLVLGQIAALGPALRAAAVAPAVATRNL